MSIWSSISLVCLVFGVVLGVVLHDLFHPLVIGHAVLAIVFCMLSLRRSESSPEVPNRDRRLPGAHWAVFAVMMAVLAVLYGFVRSQNIQVDFTADKIHSLSLASQEVLKKIDGSVTFSLVAGRSTEEGTQALELVNRYARALPTARTTMLDPRKSPELQKRFGLTASDALVILYRNDEGKEFQKKLSSISERTITAALRSFVSPSRSVYVTQGNGEPSLNDSGAAGLTKMVAYAADQGFDVKPLLLPAVGAMPDDASLVVVLSPQKNFSDRERMLVEHYFSQGGNAMFLQDPDSSNAIPQLALQFGIGFSRSVVLDQEDLMYGADPIGWQLLLKDFSGHAITRSMSSNKFAVFLIASPLRLLEEYKQDRKYHTILSSGARSWAERDLEILNQENPEAHFNEGEDMRGPFPLAVAAEFTTGSQVLAFGDSQWVQNVNVDLFSHRELWLSSLQWASRAPFAMIPTRQMKFSYMPIGQGFYNVLLMLCYILPELVVIFGLLLHHGRSKRWQLA